MSDFDPKARLADWFRQWGGPLRRFLRGRSAIPASDVDDVAQEVFLRLLRYERAELVEHPQAYLYKMASNVAAEWSIRSRHSQPHDSGWLTDLTSDDDPERAVARDQAAAEVRRAIDSLASKQRGMLKLHYFDGLGYTHIAERFGVSERSVKRALTKGYHKLRHELPAQLLGEITDGRE